jgi:glucose-6-phosphate isomerase
MSSGDQKDHAVLDTFYMFDFIGGRYSVTSAVGGLPLSIVLGCNIFERFLKGAEQMNIHAKNTPHAQIIPLVAALISI